MSSTKMLQIIIYGQKSIRGNIENLDKKTEEGFKIEIITISLKTYEV